MFVVTLLLNEIIGWMRRQPGTSSLRAILYMDEIFGYFPPSAVPPSKPPMLTLLKQARAYGLGVVLATQNPVDLDYKGLGNTGTWLIGRLQTERDRDRLLDGLTTALAGGGPSREELARLLGGITQRVFLMRNVHDDAPVLLKSRWALSYLRGPLTPAEISRLMSPRKQQAASHGVPPLGTHTAGRRSGFRSHHCPPARRCLPRSKKPSCLSAAPPTASPTSRAPSASRKLHFVDKPAGVDEWQQVGLAATISDDGKDVLWDEFEACISTALTRDSVAGATFADLPSGAQRAANYAQWGKSLAAYLYQNQKLQLWSCDVLKQLSRPGESEGDFRSRLALAVREQRDVQVGRLREKFAPKLTTLQGQRQRAIERAERERGQLSQQKFQAAISVGATILGAFLGRKAISVGNIGRATTAARSATRIGQESEDVQRAEESAGQIEQRIADLNKECEAAIAALDTSLDAQQLQLRAVSVTPRKTDIAIGQGAAAVDPMAHRSRRIPRAGQLRQDPSTCLHSIPFPRSTVMK